MWLTVGAMKELCHKSQFPGNSRFSTSRFLHIKKVTWAEFVWQETHFNDKLLKIKTWEKKSSQDVGIGRRNFSVIFKHI